MKSCMYGEKFGKCYEIKKQKQTIEFTVEVNVIGSPQLQKHYKQLKKGEEYGETIRLSYEDDNIKIIAIEFELKS